MHLVGPFDPTHLISLDVKSRTNMSGWDKTSNGSGLAWCEFVYLKSALAIAAI